MTTARPEALLRHIRKLAGAEKTDPQSDRELLRRFATRRDEGAFTMMTEGALPYADANRLLLSKRIRS